jgi:hypothetical protein
MDTPTRREASRRTRGLAPRHSGIMVVQPLKCCACDYVTPDDVVAIDNMLQLMGFHTTQMHTQTPAPAPAPAIGPPRDPAITKIDRRSRPVVSIDMSEHDWRFFVSEWEDYKVATGVTGTSLVTELWSCMNDELRRLAFNQGGKTGLTTEALMLARIQSLAVTILHAAVHTVELHEAKQASTESIRLFTARVRGIATNCNLAKACVQDGCTAIVSFIEETVYHVTLAGLYDTDMKERALAAAILKTVNNITELVEFCAADEASGKTAIAMVNSMRTSTYRQGRRAQRMLQAEEQHQGRTRTQDGRPPHRQDRQDRQDHQQDRGTQGPRDRGPARQLDACRHCGDAPHEDLSRATRSRDCPAYNSVCGVCNYRGHYTSCHGVYMANRVACLEQDCRQQHDRTDEEVDEAEVSSFGFI